MTTEGGAVARASGVITHFVCTDNADQRLGDRLERLLPPLLVLI